MNKVLTGAVGVALLAAAVASPAYAADAIKAGNLELGINGQFLSPDEGDDTLLVLTSLGYFYTDHVQISGSLIYVDSEGFELGLLGLGADYHFAEIQTNLVPFVGGSYTLSFGDFDETDFLEAHAGLKQFISERTSLEYQIQRFQPVDSDFSDFGQYIVSVGLNFYL